MYLLDSNIYINFYDRYYRKEFFPTPWLIAIAKKENYTIVTDEIKNVNLNDVNPSRNAKVPDVCEKLNVQCISMNQFFKEISLSI
ncbi:Uncharacterised protein [Streptococcus pneumoniae]|nr:DUF4411 family protein [Streptococcus pneumoniae]MDS4872858.1 DUF4411 family protein [Streptococcus pneumoniae]MDS9208325.1 DUF4411 family protein [Streptococcus pneumoniae]MDT5910320.1 DUF4411 family protein [Streptococcus pneumoniae]VJE34752.1 Uncharacterised protein [Streptococcus pneumoniae]